MKFLAMVKSTYYIIYILTYIFFENICWKKNYSLRHSLYYELYHFLLSYILQKYEIEKFGLLRMLLAFSRGIIIL